MKHSFLRVILVSILALGSASLWAQGFIARAQFSSDVVDREPIDDIGATIKVDYDEIQRVYFFTDLRDMEGSQVLHRWSLDGEVEVEIPFDIGGTRWRVWSSKRLMPGFDGHWTVDIVQDGDVVETYSFEYVDE